MSEHNRGGSWFSGFMIGSAIGAAIALLTAKRTGEETREMLQIRGQEITDKAMEAKEKAAKMAQEAKEQAGNKISDVRSRAKDAVHELRREGEYQAEDLRQAAQHDIPHTGVMSHVDDIDEQAVSGTTQASRFGAETPGEARTENEIMEDDNEKTYDL